MVETKSFSRGSPVAFISNGVKKINSSDRRGKKSYAGPIEDSYGASISDDIGKLCRHIYRKDNPDTVVKAVVEILDESYDDSDILDLLDTIDTKLDGGLAARENGASVTQKSKRDDIRVSSVVDAAGEEGAVYMAKSLTSMKKVKLAWNLHEDNQVVVVDDYELWEELLGWSKLKELPHGRKKIRRLYGDSLPQDVLDEIAPPTKQSRSSDSNTSSKSRTTTSAKEAVVNVAKDSQHRMRTKSKASRIKDLFESDGHFNNVKRLVLFPSDTDKNMTDYWWVAGGLAGMSGYSAIANCKQSTYDYLKDVDNIHHIDEYVEMWRDYSITTEHGSKKYRYICNDEPVLHILKEKLYNRFITDGMLSGLSEIIADFVDDNVYKGPDIPQESTYCILDGLDEFYLRPILRDHTKSDSIPTVHALETKASTGNGVYTDNISSTFGLYARGMLPNWDFDSTEMQKLESLSYNLKLDDGGYEIIQTMKQLHDAGGQPYSKTPQARWRQ